MKNGAVYHDARRRGGWPLAARAQQATRTYTIGPLSPSHLRDRGTHFSRCACVN